MLNREGKKVVIDWVQKQAEQSCSMLVANYRGLDAASIGSLRKAARDNNVVVRVVKNNLTKIALKDTHFEHMTDALSGPTMLAFAKDEPSVAARVFKNFIKTNKACEVHALSVGDGLLDSSYLSQIASLPTLNEALSQLAAVMIAPVAKFVRTCNDIPARTVRVVAAVKDSK